MTRAFLPCTEALIYSLPHQLELQNDEKASRDDKVSAYRGTTNTMSQEQGKAQDAAQNASEQSPETVNKKATQEGHADINGQPEENEKQTKQEPDNSAPAARWDTQKSKPGPSGGFDSTPIPSRPPGYTIKVTLHRAENLPIADVNGFSSDPYCLAQINTDTPNRHKEDPPLRWRTPTVRKNTEPEWNEEWIIANVPASGLKMKVRIYDEDLADKDDLLGKVHVTVPQLDESWPGIKNQGYKLIAHDGSKRAYLLQALTTCFRQNKHFRGYLYLSIEMLGRTAEDGQSGRLYTVGPCRWTRHYSPILGRIVNVKDPDQDDAEQAHTNGAQTNGQQPDGKPKKKVDHYNFQANQMQLQGPVPAQLYHRFVEFKPWVGRMFTSAGLSGVLMSKALHHQHARVYNFGRSTVWGHFPEGPSPEMTKKFLDLVHYDQGGRIYTYVITLDALWRFTETGKEFGIDMLSKHTMHSDVSIYIAFSGEFFIRRLKHRHRPPPPDPVESSSQSHPPQHEENEEHPPSDINGSDDAPKDPASYELVIDNDSGTYRPNADLLPLLQTYLSHQLPGLHILTLDCNKDAERQQRMKKEQRERKKSSGEHIVYTMRSRSSSISSSDVDELDHIEAGLEDEDAIAHEHGVFSQAAKDAKLRNKQRVNKLKRDYKFNNHNKQKRDGGDGDEEGAIGGDEALRSART
ncbi:uncharacterized protein MYCFIDRAFT_155927 [Pseudocercospora fijiensis CIRAD86]|uniref:C2 domain-containing protein n=1 Tax=Pseudocercospora fijiensis (strain CIRAD86) TaxID=383855 RepID=M2YQY3_PSEFD|nr:uncharacterized protein MYCFIDRAFT_155927 [Pseudocercospora fijiensis CIRAD86]EME80125.1 hypothetical protein MYCFIDRAFT_155927 [Pseudocercospora fijiensis CIRAD86]